MFRSYLKFLPGIRQIERRDITIMHEIFSRVGYGPVYADVSVHTRKSFESALSIVDLPLLVEGEWETNAVLSFAYRAADDPPDLTRGAERHFIGGMGIPYPGAMLGLTIATSGFDQVKSERSQRRLSYLKEIEEVTLGLMEHFEFDAVVLDWEEVEESYTYSRGQKLPSELDEWPCEV